MAKGKKAAAGSGHLFIEPSGQLRLADKSAEQYTIEDSKVECLGMTFENDDARRAYFTEKLREKLKDPEFRKIEGFPIAEDEDILMLSDPPYYTACPNPFLKEYIDRYGKPYNEAEPYHRPPFAADISEGKNDPIYTAHSYHTKVPHQAIMRFLLHYTEPGDVVLDGFAGTGMTGVAAQFCANPSPSLKSALSKEIPDAKWGPRRPVLVDLSPFAAFIAHNYNAPIDASQFTAELSGRIGRVDQDVAWAYRYSEKSAATISLSVWSDVFVCSECGADIVYWGNGVRRRVGSIDPMPCPNCGADNPKGSAEHKLATFQDPILRAAVRQPLQVPVLVRGDGIEREGSEFDIRVASRCLSEAAKLRVPAVRMLYRAEPWGDVYRAGYHSGITHVHHFYNPRQLLVLARLWNEFRASPMGRRLQLVLTSFAVRNGFRGNRFVINEHNPNGRINGPLTNCLYFPSLLAEQNIIHLARAKGADIAAAFRSLDCIEGNYCLSTQSASDLRGLPSECIDYIFIDPPFGSNIMYSEMNFLVESWLGCVTNNNSEAIVNSTQKKDANAYRALMTACLREFYRVLKPGRWLTMEFHNSQNSIWNAIQTAMGDAGFVVADVRTLDKKKGTVYQEYYVSGATKSDLVISAYKPNGGLEQAFKLHAGTPEGAWDFVRQHLRHLPVFVQYKGKVEPIAERQPFLLFDRMVAFHIQRGASVPMGASEFYSGLKQRFPERDGMHFLPEQVADYDRQRLQVSDIAQLAFFVSDERSAIEWLRQQLGRERQTYQQIQPKFLRELHKAGHEQMPELRSLLEQSFLEDGAHRWYVPDPNKQLDLEKLRERSLLREFDEYKSANRLKIFRTEAIRVGFKAAWSARDYQTIISVARKLPEDVLQDDQTILMYYDNASMRVEA